MTNYWKFCCRNCRQRGRVFVSDWINLITAVQTCYCHPPPACRAHFRITQLGDGNVLLSSNVNTLLAFNGYTSEAQRFILTRTVGEPALPLLVETCCSASDSCACVDLLSQLGCQEGSAVILLTTCYTPFTGHISKGAALRARWCNRCITWFNRQRRWSVALIRTNSCFEDTQQSLSSSTSPCQTTSKQ